MKGDVRSHGDSGDGIEDVCRLTGFDTQCDGYL